MKKALSIALVCLMMLSIFAACGNDPAPSSTASSTPSSTVASTASSEPVENAEIVDGKFVEKRSITVEVFDRNVDGGTPPEDNFYTDFIKEGMLRDHNVEVTFKPIPRWTEVEQLNNLLAAGDAPDICYTYNQPTINTYANMGAVVNLTDYILDNKDLLPNLWDFMGETYLFWSQDPNTGDTWSIKTRMSDVSSTVRINCFVREDWLNKLNLPEPKTLEEFESMLFAFKDNAELLLGADAKQMIPYSTGYYVSYDSDHLIMSYVPEELTEREQYIYGFDRSLYPNFKEGVKKLNEWYNQGLIWQDFALYGSGDNTGTNLKKAGYVGAYMGNWDTPYRGGEDSVHATMINNVDPDAAFIAVEPFLYPSGNPVKRNTLPADRNIFFPSTNKEPLASLMYLDWICTYENYNFIQIGEEGVTHETLPGGVVKAITVKNEKQIMSPSNIDYTMTLNGLNLSNNDITLKSLALGYGFVDERFITRAHTVGSNFSVAPRKNVNLGEVKAEEGVGPALNEKRDTFHCQAVTAKPDQFDAVYDSGLKDYLDSGAQAIIDERTAKWAAAYGNSETAD